MSPREEYDGRLARWRAAAERARRREELLANVRLAVFAAGAVAAWFIIDAGAAAVGLLALPVGAFAASVVVHGTHRRARRRAEQACAHYEAGVARLDHAFAGRGRADAPFPVAHHPYASHLDLFGPGGLYEHLSRARSRAGQATLARWLLAPAPAAEVRARQKAVAELRERLELREELALIDAELVAALDADDLAAWGEALPVVAARAPRAAALALPVLTLATIGLLPLLGAWPLLVVLGAQGGFAFAFRTRVQAILEAAEKPVAELALIALVLERLERESFRAERLAALRRDLATEGLTPSERLRQLLRRVDTLDWRLNQMFALFTPLLLWSTNGAFAIEAWRVRWGGELRRWVAAVGGIEALLDLAAYAFERPDEPFPDIADDGARFEAERLAHPLLAEAVPNDLRLDHEHQLVVVTGSNMSGKSTLLRAVGVNAVLALAGAPVRARSLTLAPLQVAASIRTVDSLQDGASRFYAEITALRDVVALTGKPWPVLFLLDEMLAGTNSRDRRIGAAAVVRGLLDRGALGMVTTHDLALAQLADELGARATNAHFECRLEAGQLVFDYTLRPGVVRESNALELMRAVGLDVPAPGAAAADAPSGAREPD